MPHQVKPEGDPNNKICFIGEAPGGSEERLGRPFVGPAGQLLDECLHQVGIRRKDCYLTNVVKERPPNNEISHFIDLSKAQPKITEAGYDYLEAFKEEIAKTKSNVLVPLGNVPLWALTGLKAISKRHGSILSSESGRKVIPCIHPAAALREYLYKYYIQADLRRILKESEFPEIKLTNYKYILQPTFEEAISYMLSLYDGSCAFDIEVLNGEISCFSLSGSQSNGTISIPLTDESGDYFTPEQEVEIFRLLTEVLENPNIEIRGQNLSFDASYMHTKYGIVISNMQDTMVQAGILYPDLPKGLDFLTATYTDMPYYKDDGKQWFKLGGSFKDLWLYNAKDSAVI